MFETLQRLMRVNADEGIPLSTLLTRIRLRSPDPLRCFTGERPRRVLPANLLTGKASVHFERRRSVLPIFLREYATRALARPT